MKASLIAGLVLLLPGLSTACRVDVFHGQTGWTEGSAAEPAPLQPDNLGSGEPGRGVPPAQAALAPAAPPPPPVALPSAAPPAPALPQVRTPVTPVPGAPASFADLVEGVQSGVVNIYTTQVNLVRPGGYAWDPFRGPTYVPPQSRRSESLGTGFLVDDQGYILTNVHVVEGASDVRVKLFDEREVPAQIIGTDPATDIAVIKIAPVAGVRPLRLGDSDRIRVGDWVVAIGNPFGLSSSVTAGILSAKGRRDVPIGGNVRYVDFLQTDTSINPGNSGGPLINMAGEVVGINTAINREAQGICFSIPINMARQVIGQLRASGHVSRSWLGVQLGDIDAQTAMQLRLPEPKGALVARVVPGGPADKGGMLPGDVIVRFNDKEIRSGADLRLEASAAGVGSTARLSIFRNGRESAVDVRLGELPSK
jgi:serine protease Do